MPTFHVRYQSRRGLGLWRGRQLRIADGPAPVLHLSQHAASLAAQTASSSVNVSIDAGCSRLTVEEVLLWPHYDGRLIRDGYDSSAALRTLVVKGTLIMPSATSSAASAGGFSYTNTTNEENSIPVIAPVKPIVNGLTRMLPFTHPTHDDTDALTTSQGDTESCADDDAVSAEDGCWWRTPIDWWAMRMPEAASLALPNPLTRAPSSHAPNTCPGRCSKHIANAHSHVQGTLCCRGPEKHHSDAKAGPHHPRASWLIRCPDARTLRAVVEALVESHRQRSGPSAPPQHDRREDALVVGSLDMVLSRLWRRGAD